MGIGDKEHVDFIRTTLIPKKRETNKQSKYDQMVTRGNSGWKIMLFSQHGKVGTDLSKYLTRISSFNLYKNPTEAGNGWGYSQLQIRKSMPREVM